MILGIADVGFQNVDAYFCRCAVSSDCVNTLSIMSPHGDLVVFLYLFMDQDSDLRKRGIGHRERRDGWLDTTDARLTNCSKTQI